MVDGAAGRLADGRGASDRSQQPTHVRIEAQQVGSVTVSGTAGGPFTVTGAAGRLGDGDRIQVDVVLRWQQQSLLAWGVLPGASYSWLFLSRLSGQRIA